MRFLFSILSILVQMVGDIQRKLLKKIEELTLVAQIIRMDGATRSPRNLITMHQTWQKDSRKVVIILGMITKASDGACRRIYFKRSRSGKIGSL